MTLVSVADFRAWSGANIPASVPDALIQDCLDEAEAGIAAETGAKIEDIGAHLLARAEAVGEEKRRANRLLARRNSPEGVAGAGSDGLIYTIPVRDADSQRAVWHIQAHLLVPEGVA
jgi:hypothetical protein